MKWKYDRKKVTHSSEGKFNWEIIGHYGFFGLFKNGTLICYYATLETAKQVVEVIESEYR